MLIEVTRRLMECVREGDIAARLGGDEFVLILPNVKPRQDTDRIARRIVEELSRTFILNDQPCEIGASIGIAFFPDSAEDPEALIKRADEAMYEAKEAGRNGYRYG